MSETRTEISAKKDQNGWSFHYNEMPVNYAGLRADLGRVNSPLTSAEIAQVISLLDKFAQYAGVKTGETQITIGFASRDKREATK